MQQRHLLPVTIGFALHPVDPPTSVKLPVAMLELLSSYTSPPAMKTGGSRMLRSQLLTSATEQAWRRCDCRTAVFLMLSRAFVEFDTLNIIIISLMAADCQQRRASTCQSRHEGKVTAIQRFR